MRKAILLFFLSLPFCTAFALSTDLNNPQIVKEVFQVVEHEGQITPYTGVVTVELQKQLIIFEVFNDPCGSLKPHVPGTVRCQALPELISRFVVPLVSQSQACGSLIYHGYERSEEWGGDEIEITLRDHRHRLCTDIVPAPIVVEMSASSCSKKTSESYFFKSIN